jgi:acyl-CoA reductase-like NAD-dependent aldehyde dehydrogenase
MPDASNREKNLIAGSWRGGAERIPNLNPFTSAVIGHSAQATAAEIEEAGAAAAKAAPLTRARPLHERAAILARAAELLGARKAEIVATLTAELGRPVTLNATEVDRGIATLTGGAEEAKRMTGEYLPLDGVAAGANRHAYWRREPVGPVIGITPFNFPVNLLLHKLAPAVAAGCPITLKIPPQTPFTPRLIAEVMLEAGCTIPGELNVFDAAPALAETAVRDDRYKLLSFTGSPAVGWKLKSIAGKKRVLLELGNSSGAIVHHDAPELPWVAQRLCFGSFAAAGQVCISVQRIFVHERVWEKFTSLFLDEVSRIVWGDPNDPKTIMGPVIDDASAARIETWIARARDHGAKLLAGGPRKGRLIPPTVLTNVNPRSEVACAEMFGPVVSLFRYTDRDDVFAMLNDTPFGLQAGVFTDSLAFSQQAIDRCDVAAVMVNEFPMYRVDRMPYGGIKDSGLGREGVKYALDEYSEKKLIVVNTKPGA